MSQSFPYTTKGVAAMELAIRNYTGYYVWFSVAAGNQTYFATNRSPARMASPSYQYADEMYFLYCISSYGSGYKFSLIFPNSSVGSNYGSAIDYASAGEGIYTTAMGDTCRYISGTSFAAPCAAAMLLLNDGAIKNKGNITGDVDGKADKIAGL